MAYYSNGDKLKQKFDALFTTVYTPGQTVPASGIYECQGCGREDTCNKGDPFPPQNRSQHPHAPHHKPDIRWLLIVETDGRQWSAQ